MDNSTPPPPPPAQTAPRYRELSDSQGTEPLENSAPPRRRFFFQSLKVKILAMFLSVFLVALAPLALSYWQDARQNRIKNASAQLEFIAERSIRKIRPEEIAPLIFKELTGTEFHKSIVAKLRGIQQDFGVDNAILMRRGEDGRFLFIADGSGQFFINQPVDGVIHDRFPETFRAATRAWDLGRPSQSGLFGFGKFEYLQVYVPILDNGEVVATLMLNKFAEDVDQAIRAKTIGLLALTATLALLGAVGFWFFSSRMLAPLVRLKDAALTLAGGDLDVEVPVIKRRDEVSDLNESFRTMVRDLKRNRQELDRYNAQLERTLARVRLMEDLEKNLTKFVPREVSNALRADPEALERGKTEKDCTVLFLDMEGSSLLAESLGPKEAVRLIEIYFSKFLDYIYENQGDITETAGDGLMIIFQGDDPTTHAMNAVRAAVAVERATAEIQSRLAEGEKRVMINIGICSGQALVGFMKFEAISGTRITFTASGMTTIVAARLSDLATDGTVLMAQETMRRVAGRIGQALPDAKFESLGEIPLKNVQQPVEIFRLTEA